MKYQRMTKHSDLGTLHACDINGDEQPLCELTILDTDNLIGHLCKLEDKIESGELCDREEVKRETAKEILLLLGKGFDETARKDFKDLQWYKQFCRELELRYGIELFGKTEQVGNSDKLEDEE